MTASGPMSPDFYSSENSIPSNSCHKCDIESKDFIDNDISGDTNNEYPLNSSLLSQTISLSSNHEQYSPFAISLLSTSILSKFWWIFLGLQRMAEYIGFQRHSKSEIGDSGKDDDIAVSSSGSRNSLTLSISEFMTSSSSVDLEMSCQHDAELSSILVQPLSNVYKLYSKSEVPYWIRREFILTGYRYSLSLSLCLRSLFYIHNETGNIWSHLIGAVIILAYLIHGVIYLLPIAPGTLSLSALIFGIASITCMVLSCVYHLFGCVSVSCHSTLLKCDMTGISLLILGTFVSGCHFAFYCSPHLRSGYSVLLCVVAITLMTAPWSKWFLRLSWVHRAFFYSAGCCVSVIPLIHWTLTARASERAFASPILCVGFLYFIGFCFYMSGFPERYYPGKFDFWFHSHQMWHVFVLAAALLYYQTGLKYFYFLMENNCD